MDQERARIQADLRGLLRGEVRCDDLCAQMLASDASVYEIRPLGVVRPRGTSDVVACVEYARDHDLSIHARGAGTGLAGESLGRGLILDFSHFMRRMLHNDIETVRVQPGVVLGPLNRQLARYGRMFGPDPANRAVTTIGSVLANDASGSHWLKYGSARRHVESLQVVLSDGAVVELGRHKIPAEGAAVLEPADRLARDVAGVLQSQAGLVESHWPKAPVNRAGYRIQGILHDDEIHLAQLLTGSEGTLALITEATIRTVPVPRHRGACVFLFDRLESAGHAAIELARCGVTACDLMDRRLLRLACEHDRRYESLRTNETEALLLVETEADDAGRVREHLRQLAHLVLRRRKLAFAAFTASEEEDIDFYWRLARRVIPTLYRLKGSTRPLPFVEDMAVPPLRLPEFLTCVQNVLKKHEVTASLFAHAGHGQLHIRPFLDLADPEHVRRMHHLARDLYTEVLKAEGTVSGEHADGLSRTWFLRELYGPLYEVFGQIKRIFDPGSILNPGKIVDQGGQLLTQNLRPVRIPATAPEQLADGSEPDAMAPAVPPAASTPAVVTLQLAWTAEQMVHAARACNGCGACRTTAPEERMCPLFRLSPAEEASPRAKANLMRAIMTGQLDSNWFHTDDLKAIADLCFNCHQCRLECPAEVDIPRLMIECKGQYVASNGLRLSDWALARLDLVSSWASRMRPLANWVLGNRQMRWVLEKTLGIAQGRKLPRVAARSFLRRAARRRLTRPVRRGGRQVLYFVDINANWYDVKLAEALVGVMEHNGIGVYVHPRQRQSGMALVSAGALDRARRLASRNVELLADAVRQGYDIVTTEPSAALCLREEYIHLLDDADTRLVAQHTRDACEYLWDLHQTGQLELDLRPLNTTVGYHQPCHIRALSIGTPGENLLRLIPGLTVRRLDHGCSGMAGTYGIKRKNYRASLRIGWRLISAVRQPQIQLGATECTACKIQMEQGTTKPTIHPIKLLALSYGVMPEFNELLTASSEELFVT